MKMLKQDYIWIEHGVLLDHEDVRIIASDYSLKREGAGGQGDINLQSAYIRKHGGTAVYSVTPALEKTADRVDQPATVLLTP